jgi:hypothetical protein
MWEEDGVRGEGGGGGRGERGGEGTNEEASNDTGTRGAWWGCYVCEVVYWRWRGIRVA